MEEKEKKHNSSHMNFKRQIDSDDDEIDSLGDLNKVHSKSIPNEFVPRIRPKKNPNNMKYIPQIGFHKPIRIQTKQFQRNMHIKEKNNELKVSFSFDEEYNNFETKETETTNKTEESILGLRRSLSSFKIIFMNDRKSKDDSTLEIKSKFLKQYSSIIKSALAINRRHLSTDLCSFIEL